MPIFEEKLISPLAVRFTQRHIKTSFRDGRIVEETLKEITESPGVGDYDVILRAPFPHIEIIRLSPLERGMAGSDEDEHHDQWYSLDNRRLYCLQQAAAAQWPKRVAAVVQILYADTGSVRRKLDSENSGRSVSVGHSVKTPELFHWDWRKVVGRYAAHGGLLEEAALEGVLEDESKTKVAALMDAPDETVSLMAAALGAVPFEACYTLLAPRTLDAHMLMPSSLKRSVSSTESWPNSALSTTDASSGSGASTPRLQSEELASQQNRAPEPMTAGAVMQALSGTWVGQKGETYKLEFLHKTCWNCVRTDSVGVKEFLMSFDEASNTVWWGVEKSFFLDASELDSKSGQIKWFHAGDMKRQKPRCVWSLQKDSSEPTEPAPEGYDQLAGCAIREVMEQLHQQGGQGRVWLPHWNEHYRATLGALRDFLESHSDKFTVTPGQGARKYSVAIVDPEARAELEATKESMGNSAVQEIEKQVLAPDSDGFVTIPDWKQRYSAHLGSIRTFLESRPEKFVIVPKRNGKFTVAMARSMLLAPPGLA